MTKIENPYGDLTGGQWLKGNLHTHTTASDGERPHQSVIDDYAGRRYDFLMISDHDVYTSAKELSLFPSRGTTDESGGLRAAASLLFGLRP